MDDLVTWLRAQLDDDERVARAALDEWRDDDPEDEARTSWERWRLSAKLEDTGWDPPPVGFDEHWQRQSPWRVLAEVDAKRRILADYERYAAERRRAMNGWVSREISPVLAALALPYADRPGYREEWRP